MCALVFDKMCGSMSSNLEGANLDIAVVLGDYRSFITELLRRVQLANIQVEGASIDHICYRVATAAEYAAMRTSLLPFSSDCATTTHNGREFSIFRLKLPLIVSGYQIYLVELPSPKEGSTYRNGLEHIEIVVSGFPKFTQSHRSQWTGSAGEASFDASVHVTFDDGLTVKFHAHPLDEVIQHQGGHFEPVE